MLIAIVHGDVRGQESWDVSPYRIKLWLVVEHSAGLSQQSQERIAKRVESRSRGLVGAPWRLEASVVGQAQRAFVLQQFEQPDATTLFADNLELLDSDKLVLARLRQSPRGLEVTTFELDSRTRVWGNPITRPIQSVAVIADRVVQSVIAGFSPIAQIENMVDKKLRVRLRAARLALDPNSPALVRSGDVMQPISRYNDRSGKPVKDGIRPMSWTVLEVDAMEDSFATCTVHSGFSRPFAGKKSRRIERVALLVRPKGVQTVVALTSREDRSPLSGYSVYEKQDEETKLLGETDWRGQLAIANQDDGIRTIYVRSGSRTLAKLPLIPGATEKLEAALTNDRRRSEVEGFLIGVQDDLVDLVVRREVLAASIEQAIKDDDIQKASEKLAELQSLETKADVDRRVTQFRQQQGTFDLKTQGQVDRLFAETEKLLGQHLNPNRLLEVERLVSDARSR